MPEINTQNASVTILSSQPLQSEPGNALDHLGQQFPSNKKKKSKWWLWLLIILVLLGAGAAVYYFFLR